jgi:pimeloyl-ACP methyl ester carboxylesterase
VHYDTREAVRSLPVPLWVVHGDHDVIIPVRMGREVLEAAQVKGELLIVRGAGHNDVTERGGIAYWEWLRRALTSSAPATGGDSGLRP